MQDVPALPPCPAGKRGRHRMGCVTPDDDGLDMTLYCEACGAVRRLPVTGPIVSDSLDALDSADIEAAMRGGGL